MVLDVKSGGVENKMGFDHWYVFSSPAIAGGLCMWDRLKAS